MLTANTNHLDAREPMDVLSGTFTENVKLLLQYARAAIRITRKTEMSEATLRDVGISTHEIRSVSNKFRFTDELDRLSVRGNIYQPR